MTRKFIICDPEKCSGCRICDTVCSAEKEKAFNPLLARIRTVRIEYDGLPISISLTCRLCEDPKCIRVCPRNALRADEDTGVIIVNKNKCDGCSWCIEACDFGSIVLHPDKKVVEICDLCAGEPKCIDFCPRDALDLMTPEELSQMKRRKSITEILIP